MPRVVNEAAYEARRNAILDAAERAVITKGYEQMAIADILGELKISSGAFYHYFDSKPALLKAMVERRADKVEPLILSIVHDPELKALDKLRRSFAVLDREKIEHKQLVFAFLRVWYSDENAIVRQKLYSARIKRITPWLEAIIRQGIEEGVLTTAYPDQAARAVLSLFEDIGFASAELLLGEESSPEDLPRLQRLVEGSADAVERVLGAPKGSIHVASREELTQWLFPAENLAENNV
ncbi:TetR/AcrR family transcriptional regulator [Ktedonospora formicarum]|uniref:TetR family transcriptional regulator n=1 Tax=Ktedonospora formicarum TaxID=2778364 RepID=A0A8J3MUB3_9CHLR|nr:TetR/AcrR family transcriptional regulator [Ktedonospora formicarum]GHO46751.1 TetR family transcriptional regulator [Ktedonospora formicarum]